MRAAAMTPVTPQSFVPSRREFSSGFFDVDAMVTQADREVSRSGSGPTPSLILPITGPAVSASAPTLRPLPPPSPVPRRRSSSSQRPPRQPPTGWERASEMASMLGFAAAWVATTGAGAVVVAAFMTRNQPPAAPLLPAVPVAVATSAAEPAAQCPKAWEPPLFAVNDLPVAMDDAHAIRPPAGAWHPRAPAVEAAPVVPAAPAPAPVAVVHRAPAPRPVAAAMAQKPDPAPAAPRSTRAKTAAPAPSGPPHSLEDWIRHAVATDSKH